MDAALLHAIGTEIERATGHSLGACEARPVGGGCIHEAYVLVAFTPYFVKVNAMAKAGLFDAEMDALRALAATGAIRVPRPVTIGRHGDRSFLVLEHVAMGLSGASSWETFGAQLAAMHRHLSPDRSYGWHCANYIGVTPQPNAASRDWLIFWREQRLGFQLKLAGEQGVRFTGAERLLERLPLFFEGYAPEPSLLHGDLWSGNASFTDDGVPIIYDPASYHGDRECDLAFTELFGSFPAAFYEAYDQSWPRHRNWPMRRDLYNLYHVLNHFHLFGGGYRSQAQQMIHELNRLVS
ncbi:fructosamine-3-kinase [Roseimicrobium gellanilyticum]|uniref:Fructosamine-3-kinase n=1 Tax=Roseimicrobium gellanilyticum TaxID=748857 RepID=A0A366HUB4_9BACT|nr:fructosamine kinase family protein [Roseimicrobium gellanilyticum]RBP46297.1 fructosamine-3-kinase [Roseimicrobium gellanilyticum]